MATQKEVAAHIDLSPRRVSDLLKGGILPAGKGTGGLNLDACRLAYIAYLRGSSTGKVKQSAEELNANEERARLTYHQANIAALDEQQKSGELVLRGDVVAEVSGAIANCRARLLTLPTKLSTVVASIDSVQGIREVLEDGVIEALHELHNEYVDNGNRGATVETAAPTHG